MRRRGAFIPGLGLSLGLSLTYVGVLLLLPIALFAIVATNQPWGEVWANLANPRTLAAYQASLVPAFFASLVNAVFGSLVAWVLVRKRFPGRRVLDALIDIPFAMPTAVVGIALSTMYGPGSLTGDALGSLGISVTGGSLGITLAMTFVSLPFVIRTVQPVLEDLDPQLEQAAASLGAYPGTTLRRVIAPQVFPAVLAGFTLCFAKCLGEFGAVIFLAGNIPGRSEVASLLVMVRLEEFAYQRAAVVAAGLLLLSFVLLLAANALQSRLVRRSAA
jgi:sulfate/thiosulfate transport system permease protein